MNPSFRTALVLIAIGVSSVQAQEASPSPSPAIPGMPPMPKPVKEHEWFKQLEGEWTWETDMPTAEGQPPVKCGGTESARMIGGFWLIADGMGDMGGMKMENRSALSYDVNKKTYIGSVVTGMDSTLWIYTSGEVDATGKILTLHCEGPNVMTMDASQIVKYVETHEIKDGDHRVFSSKMQNPDGTFTPIMTATYTRVK